MGEKYIFSIDQFLGYYIDSATSADVEGTSYSPLILKDIGALNQRNIVIRGKFSCNFSPLGAGDSGMSYITVRRPLAGVQKAWHGYGIAWRPSASGSGEPNLFIVDNSNVIYETGSMTPTGRIPAGYRNYISAAAASIAGNGTEYYFMIVINRDNAMNVWISTAEQDLGDNGKITISCGARKPISGIVSNVAFGVAVNKTNGSVWKYQEIYIKGYEDKYPAILFDMDVSALPSQFACKYDAVGTPPQDIPADYGVYLHAYNYATRKWDLISLNSDDDIDTSTLMSTQTLSKAVYGSVAQRAQFVLIVKTPSGEVGEMSALEVKRFSLFPPPTKEVSLGGAVDVVIEDGQLERVVSQEIMVDGSNKIYLDGLTGGNLDHTPVWIEKVVFGVEETEQVHNADYVWGYDEQEYANSLRQKLYLSFASEITGNIKVTYLYSPALQAIGDMNERYHYAFKGSDIVVKHGGVYYLRVTPGSEAYRAAIVTYIEGIPWEDGTKTITYMGIISYLHSMGLSVEAVQVGILNKEELYLKRSTLKKQGDSVTIDDTKTYWVGEEE